MYDERPRTPITARRVTALQATIMLMAYKAPSFTLNYDWLKIDRKGVVLPLLGHRVKTP